MSDLQQEPDMLQIHASALEEVDAEVHDLLLGYTQSKLIYVFVEGRGDVSFYRQAIASKLKNGWKAKVFAPGNRDKVFKARDNILDHGLDVGAFAFIVDRDFHSVRLDEKLSKEFYITDGYSIENTLCSGEMLLAVLEAYYGLTDITKAEADRIVDHFDGANGRFCKFASPLTFQMVSWREKCEPVLFSRIKPSSWSGVREDYEIISGEMPSATLSSQCHALSASECCGDDILTIRYKVIEKYDLKEITRGKFVAWFFCKYLEVLPKIFAEVIGSNKKLASPSVTIGPSNFTAVCGAQADIPETLWRFLNSRFPGVSVAMGEELVS